MPKINPQDLHKFLSYDPLTGKLRWKPREVDVKGWNKKYANKEAFTADNGEGYRCGAIMGESLKAHWVVWALHYGAWCPKQIDHIDGDKSNNAIGNLRMASHSENQRNKGKNKNNSSGFKGVSWREDRQKWYASIGVDGKQKNLGYFDNKEDAAIARDVASKKYHGDFSVMNFEVA